MMHVQIQMEPPPALDERRALPRMAGDAHQSGHRRERTRATMLWDHNGRVR